MNDQEDLISLYAVGDVCVNREQPDSMFEFASATVNQADIAFCQLEAIYSERGTQSGSSAHHPAHPRNVSALKTAGFDVISMAGNHVMDFGADALADTIELLERTGIHTVGAGKNIAAARKPVIIERKGIRSAFLAYNSILRKDSWADVDKPGCAPIRVSTTYEPVEPNQPGCPARISTAAYKDDVEAMKQDVANVRKSADVVILSLHWGVHFTPAVLADYQREVAHAAIDAGVDLILGTHAHILKGIEIYKGKVITYCLCNFGFDNHWTPADFEKPRFKELDQYYPNRFFDPEYPTYTFPIDSRKTLLLKCSISKKGVQRVSFLPVVINNRSQPEILTRNDKRSLEVFNYMNELCRPFDTRLAFEGDEVLIHSESAR